MNREILFRGRRLDNGEWAEGFYFCRDTQHYIKVPVVRNGVMVLTDYEVNPDTIGQFTGLLDKNGKRVFEGDVLQDKFGCVYEVDYCESWAAFRAKKQKGFDEDGNLVKFIAGSQSFIGNGWRDFEVITNIHEPRGENDGE